MAWVLKETGWVWDANVTDAPGYLTDYIGTAINDTIAAAGAHNRATLGAGNDTYTGNWGDDQVEGGDGNDTLIGLAGSDYLVGGAGNYTLGGGFGNDRLIGGDGNDLLVDFAGNDTLLGGAGDDRIETYHQGYVANVTASGGDGNDYFLAQLGGAYAGDAGNDTFYLKGKAISVSTGLGFDKVILAPGPGGTFGASSLVTPATDASVSDFRAGDTLRIDWSAVPANAAALGYPTGTGSFAPVQTLTSTGLDFTWGYGNAHVFLAGVTSLLSLDSATGEFYLPGSTISGTSGNDTLQGDASAETINGLEGNDSIHGNDGVDKIDGGAGFDQLYGDGGSDSIAGGAGFDIVDGGAGNDFIYGDLFTFVLYANTLGNNDYLLGGDGNDTIYGEGIRPVQGSTKDRTFYDPRYLSVGGDDYINSGNGNDLILGQGGNDNLHGGAGNDVISGGYGDDYINGDAGDDVIECGVGLDHVWGGGGNDTFLLDNSYGTVATIIHDFGLGDSYARTPPYYGFTQGNPRGDDMVQYLQADGLHIGYFTSGGAISDQAVLLGVTRTMTFDTLSATYHL